MIVTLRRLLAMGGQTAGFLLPVFEDYEGANYELVQEIDQDNRITSFTPIWVDRVESVQYEGSCLVALGDESIWAFRDNLGKVHLDTASRLKVWGQTQLRSGVLRNFPMAAAELASFCSVEAKHPEVLLLAFKAGSYWVPGW